MYMPHYVHGGDIEQWLGGGWFWANLSHTRRVAACLMHDQFDHDNRDETTVMDVDNEAHIIPLTSIQLHWPVCGAINTVGGYVLHVERVQTRQWRRTFNDRCVRGHVPCASAVRASPDSGHVTASINRLVVKELFDPTYYDWDRAVRLLSKRPTVAVNPYVYLSGNGNAGYLHYRNRIIGRAEDKWNTMIQVLDSPTLGRVLKSIGGPDVRT